MKCCVSHHIALCDRKDTGLYDHSERRVTSIDANLALCCIELHHIRLFIEKFAVRRHNCKLELLCHSSTSYLALATTSSIVPAFKKCPSGMSSCFPSMISLKPLIVSVIGTYLPGIPVNCSATWNGCDRNR